MKKKIMIAVFFIITLFFITSCNNGNGINADQVFNQIHIMLSAASFALPAEAQTVSGFVLIKGGPFTMGSPGSELDRIKDEIEHRVTISDFYIAESEVTQKEYREIMNSNPGEFKGDNLPVENVTWFDAVQYCNALSKKDGLTPVYAIHGKTVTWNRDANGYRLPTEAEWEYACRAGTTTAFNTDKAISDRDANFMNHYGYNTDASGRVTGGYRHKTTAVNSFKANKWGLFDMHGNVWEWCWDWYAAYDKSLQNDPSGAAAGTYRINRGGGWNDFPKHIRSAYRAASPPDNGSFNLGFRLAKNAD